MQWEIRYYTNEMQYKNDCPGMIDIEYGSKQDAINHALQTMKQSNQFKFYEIVQK